MLDAREAEQRILSLLDELVSDNICGMLNAIVEIPGDPGGVAPYQDALRSLLARGHVILSLERDPERDYVALSMAGSLKIIDCIPDELVAHAYGNQWGWKSRKKWEKPYDVALPEIVATDAGLSEAKKIVQERGERWWR